MASNGRQGKPRDNKGRHVKASLEYYRQGKDRQVRTRQDRGRKAEDKRLVTAGQEKTSQGKTKQKYVKASQGKTREDNGKAMPW